MNGGIATTLLLRVLSGAVLTLALCGKAQATPGPGPGEPYGDDDAGCVPLRSELQHCSDTAAKAYSKLETAIAKCHAKQAAARFSEVVLGSPKSFDEEVCESAALDKYASVLDGLDASGNCASSPLLVAASDVAGALSASLDARGADLWCDATSGTAIDPGGDDAGTVPAGKTALTCAKRLTTYLAKLSKSVVRCHQQMAAQGLALADPPYDEEGCEQDAVGKFDYLTFKLKVKGDCPVCFDDGIDTMRDDLLARLDADNAALYPCPDPVLHLGTPVLDRPTLMALGVQLPITGDENRNASVSLRYRALGAPGWIDGLPLLRVMPDTVPSGGGSIAEQFAGSIFDLRPDTDYEIELHAVDADGAVDETRLVTATTRAVPGDPAMPNPVAVADATALAAALANAAPGDVITLADGTYHGTFEVAASGTAANPIVVRGSSRDGTVIDGDDCDCNVFEVYGSYVHVENMTLRHANRALRFQTDGTVGNVARRLHTADTRLGIATHETQYDFYICDNLLEGRLVWPQIYLDDGGMLANEDGINVQGLGHVVCHNQLVGFGDAMKTEVDGARAVDFYGNEVLSAYDNGVELDRGEGNVRAWRNRFTNNFVAISFQPVYGGPAYALRNVVVNDADEQLKFHGLGDADGPSGVLVYNNTFVSSGGMALQLYTSAASHNFEIRNNLFVGPEMLSGTRTVEWTGPIVGGLFDSNGYYPDGVFRFNLPPAGLISWANFATMQAGGMETSGSLLVQPVFQSGLVAPASYTTTMTPQDATLDATSNAVDAGAQIAGVTDSFQGAAPDLGALERGCPLPIFGIRPPGTDESNEPVGCE